MQEKLYKNSNSHLQKTLPASVAGSCDCGLRMTGKVFDMA